MRTRLFFFAAASVQSFYGGALLLWPGRPLFLIGIVGNAPLIGLYAVTRTTGIPLVGPDVGMIAGATGMDVICTLAETVLVLVLAGLIGKLESGASLWAQLWTWRCMSVAACALILAAVARIVKKIAPQERARRVAIVAFHPLTLYESAAGGHNDFLMVAATAWSFALVDELPLIAGLLLGAAIAIKYFAAILLPFIALRAARKSVVAAAIVVVLAVLVSVLCFPPFAFGTVGKRRLRKVGGGVRFCSTRCSYFRLLAVRESIPVCDRFRS